MSKIGMIVCQMLEDETVEVLSTDPNISEIIILINEYSKNLWDRLRMKCKTAIKLIGARNESEFAKINPKKSGFITYVKVLKLGLHSFPKKIKEEVYTSIEKFQPHVDAIFVGYGLCGNTLKDVEKRFKEAEVPVVILKDAKGGIVDDCVGLALGGNESYLRELRKCAGTFFLTPMWAANWQSLLGDIGIGDLGIAKWIFEKVGYERALMINTSIEDLKTFRRNCENFASLFDFRLEKVDGTMEIFKNCFSQAKKLAVANAYIKVKPSKL